MMRGVAGVEGGAHTPHIGPAHDTSINIKWSRVKTGDSDWDGVIFYLRVSCHSFLSTPTVSHRTNIFHGNIFCFFISL